MQKHILDFFLAFPYIQEHVKGNAAKATYKPYVDSIGEILRGSDDTFADLFGAQFAPDPDEAVRKLRHAIEQCKACGQAGHADVLMSLDPNQAEECFHRSLKLRDQSKPVDRQGMSYDYGGLGRVFLFVGKVIVLNSASQPFRGLATSDAVAFLPGDRADNASGNPDSHVRASLHWIRLAALRNIDEDDEGIREYVESIHSAGDFDMYIWDWIFGALKVGAVCGGCTLRF